MVASTQTAPRLLPPVIRPLCGARLFSVSLEVTDFPGMVERVCLSLQPL